MNANSMSKGEVRYLEFPKELRPLFENPVTSLEDYRQKIDEITKYVAEKEQGKGLYYRGDEAATNVQCKLFSAKLLSQETERFNKWKKNCCTRECGAKKVGDIFCLAAKQHYNGTTRLLDFSTDPYVALRFACGSGKTNAVDRIVTVFVTDCKVIDVEKDGYQKSSQLMRLVEDDKVADNKIFRKDHFIQMPRFFDRINRQKGLFLFMGNFADEERECAMPRYREEKVSHSLSAKTGRGVIYTGFVGTLKIPANVCNDIRTELEAIQEYKIEYLLPREKELKCLNL